VTEVQPRAVELIREVRATRAGTDLVVGAVHDVVGEELRAPLEEVLESLLPILGVELVLLLYGDPGKL
jgi:energy-converting hydrogenase Eha subunit E